MCLMFNINIHLSSGLAKDRLFKNFWTFLLLADFFSFKMQLRVFSHINLITYYIAYSIRRKIRLVETLLTLPNLDLATYFLA